MSPLASMAKKKPRLTVRSLSSGAKSFELSNREQFNDLNLLQSNSSVNKTSRGNNDLPSAIYAVRE